MSVDSRRIDYFGRCGVVGCKVIMILVDFGGWCGSSCKSLGIPFAHLRAIRLLAGGVWTPDGLGRSLREGGRDPWPVKDLMRGGGPDLFGHVIEVGFSPYQLCFQHDIE